MPIPNMKSRDAIFQAIKEFDEIGREAFLRKYGFRGPCSVT